MAADEPAIVAATALLHDVGHYPFCHALEEIGVAHHEEVARDLITGGEVAAILRKEYGAEAPARVMALIQGKSQSPLQGLISGSLDLDKIDYLKRDAKMCGVPYGEIDEDRLIFAIVLLADPTTNRTVTGVRAKALSALESLLFAKYQMYRNVYWHHAVRSATAMYKRLVEDALRAHTLDAASLVRYHRRRPPLRAGIRHAEPAPRRDPHAPPLQARLRDAGRLARGARPRLDRHRSRPRARRRGATRRAPPASRRANCCSITPRRRKCSRSISPC